MQKREGRLASVIDPHDARFDAIGCVPEIFPFSRESHEVKLVPTSHRFVRVSTHNNATTGNSRKASRIHGDRSILELVPP